MQHDHAVRKLLDYLHTHTELTAQPSDEPSTDELSTDQQNRPSEDAPNMEHAASHDDDGGTHTNIPSEVVDGTPAGIAAHGATVDGADGLSGSAALASVAVALARARAVSTPQAAALESTGTAPTPGPGGVGAAVQRAAPMTTTAALQALQQVGAGRACTILVRGFPKRTHCTTRNTAAMYTF